MSRRALLLAAAVAGGALLPVPASAVSIAERTLRISQTPGGVAGAGQSSRPAVSPAGRLVAFDSTAPDLTADPNGPVRDVFLRDRLDDTTRLISEAPGGAGADGPSTAAALAESDTVAFVSEATNLVRGDSNGHPDVFVRTALGPVERASVASRRRPANGPSTQPDLSRSGRILVFTSAASNLVPGDENKATDVFVYDRETRAVRRVSAPRSGEEPNGASLNPAVSPDGRYVSFASRATNLAGRDRNKVPDVFLADLVTRRVERVSLSGDGDSQNRAVLPPFAQVSDVSAGGRLVVFDSDATNLVRGDRNRDTDVFLRDRRRRSTRRVSRTTAGGEAGNDSFNPTMSPSGRFVAFTSFAENLAYGDAPGEDVFVIDLQRTTTTVAGVTSRGSEPRGRERVRQLLQRPGLSDDAGVIAFGSSADDLAPGDGNRAEDVYVRRTDAPRGGFVRGPRPLVRTRRPSIRLRADDPAATRFLCSLDGRRFTCGLRTRLPRLSPGRHVLRVSAGGPGMLYSARTSVRRFRVLP